MHSATPLPLSRPLAVNLANRLAKTNPELLKHIDNVTEYFFNNDTTFLSLYRIGGERERYTSRR